MKNNIFFCPNPQCLRHRTPQPLFHWPLGRFLNEGSFPQGFPVQLSVHKLRVTHPLRTCLMCYAPLFDMLRTPLWHVMHPSLVLRTPSQMLHTPLWYVTHPSLTSYAPRLPPYAPRLPPYTPLSHVLRTASPTLRTPSPTLRTPSQTLPTASPTLRTPSPTLRLPSGVGPG